MEFNHIKDCWKYLRDAKDYNELIDRVDELPRWSGEWTIEKSEDGNCLVRNEFFDRDLDCYDEDEEELDIEFLNEEEEE